MPKITKQVLHPLLQYTFKEEGGIKTLQKNPTKPKKPNQTKPNTLISLNQRKKSTMKTAYGFTDSQVEPYSHTHTSAAI